MGFKRELESHLKEWKKQLLKLHAPKEMWIPDRFKVVDQGNRKETFSLTEPICLAALPLGNANSTKERRIWAFIEGSFDVETVDGDERLREIGASVVFFEAKVRPKRFRLLDAYHFDFHVQPDRGSAPHPLYHSQRGLKWHPDRYRSALEAGPFESYADYRFPELHVGLKSSLFKLNRVRIPTARLDLFGLILVTTADMLVKHDIDTHRDAFDALVGLIEQNTSPLAKLRREEAYLPDCFSENRAVLSNWYPLYARLPEVKAA